MEIEFEWDDINLFHVLVQSPRGITPELLEELKGNAPRFFQEDREGKSGAHRMIAPDNSGRFWTVILLQQTETLWRPITGWPSTNRQINSYREETDEL